MPALQTPDGLGVAEVVEVLVDVEVVEIVVDVEVVVRVCHPRESVPSYR